MIRVVVDTNVYISALVFGGTPARALQSIEALGIEIVVSREIESELVDTLTEKFGWSATLIRQACARLWQSAYRCDPRELRDVVRDADDNHVIAAAVDCGASLILTGDGDLLALESYEGIQIVTPAAFLKLHFQ